MIDRDSTDFPEPDSPTMPRVRPRSRVRLTFSTARTGPRDVAKVVLRSRDLEQVAGPRVRAAVDTASSRGHSALSRTSKRARMASPR